MTTATTKQKLKDLMRFRNTEYQALTLYQIAHEIYSDIIEEHVEHYTQMFYQKKTGHLRNLMREIRKTDDEFRWLCVLPPDKTNKVDNSGRRIRPYVEYRYLNIIASKTPEFLSARNEYWHKRRTAMIEGIKRVGKREDEIIRFQEWKAKIMISSNILLILLILLLIPTTYKVRDQIR